MNPKARKFLLGVIFAIFIISDLVLIKSNLWMKNELLVANRTIARLQKNAFHDDVMISNSAASSEILLYNYPQQGNTPSASSDQAGSIKPVGSGLTPGVSLLDLKSKYLGKAARSEFTLFVFFSPTDCPACLLEAPIWQRFHIDSQRLNLHVIGVMNHSHKTEAEQFLKQLGVTFPVLFDNTAFLKNRYMIGETPEKILIDSQGKTLLISPGNKTEEEKRAFKESVLTLIGKSPH